MHSATLKISTVCCKYLTRKFVIIWWSSYCGYNSPNWP